MVNLFILKMKKIKNIFIYFNNNNEEIKKNFLEENDKVKEIKIKIDYQVTSLSQLFDKCDCLGSINF